MQADLVKTLLNHFLLDSNADGCVDGVAACFVPLPATAVTPPLWAAMANLAARLGLESPAIHLPFVYAQSELQPWHCPLFIALTNAAAPFGVTGWTEAASETALIEMDGLRVSWVMRGEQRGLWLYGTTQAELANWLNQLAAAAPEAVTTKIQSGHAPRQDLDLAALYSGEGSSLFSATQDGFTPDACCVHLVLGPETDAEIGAAAVNLAARLGLESAGVTFPLVSAATTVPEAVTDAHQLLLGFPQDQPTQLSVTGGVRQHQLGAPLAHYLAAGYPFLNEQSQQAGDEQQTIQATVAALRAVLYAQPPVAKLALAEVQAGRSLHLLAAGAPTPANLRRVIFRQEWTPADGLDDRQRVQQLWQEQVAPLLNTTAPAAQPQQITLFCNAPVGARQRLAAACCRDLATTAGGSQLQVLPVHKAGLAWLLETQVPLLQQQAVAQVTLYFQEFRPASTTAPWLDLPTRWLQELFPGDELLAQQLGLPLTAVQCQMQSQSCEVGTQTEVPTYRLEAFDGQGVLLHADELYLQWNERLYMSGLPQFGLVHPTTGGVVVRWADGKIDSWQVPTDGELFWDFYQSSVLPALRQHLLTSSGGRPTPLREPYFDQLAIDVTIGGPDEALGLYEEFVSVGEALHEDLYFNTLEYLAVLGEAFGGRSIEAAGQVVPWIHDYYGANGEVLPVTGPRATITLYDWAVPCTLPDLGLTVGDRRDMPLLTAIRVKALTIDKSGTTIEQITVEACYPDAKQAHFAARVLARWRVLVGNHSSFPPDLALTVDFCTVTATVATVTLPPVPAQRTVETTPVAAQTPPCDSAIIGPQQLETELAQLATLPGIHVWQVGHSYQGRPGYVIDVTLPLAAQQTHFARRKLALQKPTLLFVARHHANEVSSTTTALQMAHAAVTDPAQQQWLKQVNLVFLPMENPDGAALHYTLMAEHPRWKHHAARFNAAGQEFSRDHFDPNTPFGEARFRRETWLRWLPDAIVDNHGVPSHEWCQPFAGYTTPPRFRVCYHVVQAMLYGIIAFPDDPALPHLRQAAHALRGAVAQAVRATPWLHQRNQYWLAHYHRYGHDWLPDLSPVDLHDDMLFFYQGANPAHLSETRRNFAMRYPQITLLDWITEVPDETAQGDYLAECAEAHRVANQAMIELLAASAAPVTRTVEQHADGRIHLRLQRERRVESAV